MFTEEEISNLVKTELFEDVSKFLFPIGGRPIWLTSLYELYMVIAEHFDNYISYTDYEQGLMLFIGDSKISPGFPEFFTFVSVDKNEGFVAFNCFPYEEYKEENNLKCLRFLLEEYQPLTNQNKETEKWYFNFKPALYKFLKIDMEKPLI